MDQTFELLSNIERIKTNIKKNPNHTYTQSLIDDKLQEVQGSKFS